MAPASLSLTLFEPTIFLRGQSAVGEDARGRRRPIDFDAPPSQLRGLLTLSLPKASKIKDISILLQGRARTDWPEGIGPNRLDTFEESTIFSQKIILFSAKDVGSDQPRRRANSVTLAEETREDRRHNTDRNLRATSPSSSFGHSFDRRNKDAERSPTIAKSISSAAARAGTAILPPTLLRDINSSRQNSNSNRASFSSSANDSPISFNTSTMQRSNSLGDRHSYFDPPPQYGPPQSSISVSPGSRSSGESASQSMNATTSTSWPGSLSLDAVPTISPNGALSTTQHPQSISAAGPSNRSILHASGRQEARHASSSVSGATGSGVRFDPQAINAAFENRTDGVSPGSRFATTGSPRDSTIEQGNALSSPEPTHFNTSNNGKGKGKAISNTTTSVASPGAGAKKGIKSLLGNLLKEDDEAGQRGQSSKSGSQEDEENSAGDYREFRKGTYTFSFSIPLPSNLPPTLHADFGSNAYRLRAHAHRSGPLTSNLTCEKEINLVHAPDEEGQDESDLIVVERNWEDSLRYIIVVMGKSFPVGSKIPIWVKFVPTEKVRIHRITATLEERTAYFAKGRRVTRHEVPRRWNLLKIAPSETNSSQGILPVISNESDALLASPLATFARAAAESYSDGTIVDPSDVLAGLMDPFGPWELCMDLELPVRGDTIINISTNHKKSNIAVSHYVKLAIRVEKIRGDGGDRKLFDILIEAPVTINHSHTAHAWLSLPDYWSVNREEGNGSSSTMRAGRGASVGDRDHSDADTAAAVADHASSSLSMRRQTAPSLVPGRSPHAASSSSSRDELTTARRPQARKSSSATNSNGARPAPPSQGRVNDDIINLSRQWLSLSATGEPTSTTIGRSTVTMNPVWQEEEYGLPTYAMIDNARGSVDLIDVRNQASVK